MASNHFGNIFKITTWGESHGRAIGVVIDGCPAGLKLSEEDLQLALSLRAPGRNPYTSPRCEADLAEIYSGVFEGVTTGTPISIIIPNQDPDPSQYAPIKDLLRPGHANYTYQKKYGIFDYRGGGRASARETAARVAAGAVAGKLLREAGIDVLAYLAALGEVKVGASAANETLDPKSITESVLFCPDADAEAKMQQAIEAAKSEGDSLGGIVGFVIKNLPQGLGDPVYEKLEANLAKAMLSIPASKGFEIGEGFGASEMRGSTHNDAFVSVDGAPTQTNHAGGTLGGISTGMPLYGRVAFKPTASIRKVQETVDCEGKPQKFQLPPASRHDPCVAIRAVPVVKAMCELVIADALLLDRCATR